MGYTTEFRGSIRVEPPLNDAEIAYLIKFNETRRMTRDKGPYFVDGTGDFGQGHDADIRDFNSPPSGQPGLWCQWRPSDDGDCIGWDGSEKFYYAPEWMTYIIDHFLKPGAEAHKSSDPQFNQFTFNHVCNGVIKAQGEDMDDRWKLIVENNVVRTVPLD